MSYQPTQFGFPTFHWPIDNACSNWPITIIHSTYIQYRIIFGIPKANPNPTQRPRRNSNCRNIDRQYFKRRSSNNCKSILNRLVTSTQDHHMTSFDLKWLNIIEYLGGDRKTERVWKFKSVWAWRRMKISKYLQPCTNSMFSRDLFYRDFLGVDQVDPLKLTSNDLEPPIVYR